ncbi:hypothetical protein BCR33DRAFT_476135 [Rhizoclosmatium globosum]|uniref:Uncharacterized protein n=1 Tax=Rhizoclosmatium globosum TaxID=329046 RepID=A0A1Y2BQ38_9FUNG|nr:hypothetical protein BCR33DRAFT_476135 [Rhizoclosmatium globosum]|eukprot:ORY36727.1 hypothetical protein BCR33DRAFT_476135 [Rhizoclosmatium globosum]
MSFLPASHASYEYASLTNSINSKHTIQGILRAKDAEIESTRQELLAAKDTASTIYSQIKKATADLDKANKPSFLESLLVPTSTRQETVSHLQSTLFHLQQRQDPALEAVPVIEEQYKKLLDERKDIALQVIELQELRGQLKDLLDKAFTVDQSTFDSEDGVFARDSELKKRVNTVQLKIIDAEKNGIRSEKQGASGTRQSTCRFCVDVLE